MNKRLEKMLKPNVGVHFFVLIGFSVFALLLEQYILAGVELGVTAVLFIFYLMHRKHRHKQIDAFARNLEDEANVQPLTFRQAVKQLLQIGIQPI